ncbi:MAG: hypothetical protein RIE06_33705 [Roseibium album]|uniref:type III secretion apparatus assembly protein SctX n=1 Tax=Roseibium album TaxID=311410 RepID=UPI000CF0F0FB|nr:hypothetical protein [Labrenzia sp. EL_142]
MSAISLESGLDSISYRRIGDEDGLPAEGKIAPGFIVRHQELDKILRRTSLDQKLPDLLQPASLDPELLEPSILSGSREAAQQVLRAATANATGSTRDALQKAADILAQEMQFDSEVRTALASLMKG